VESNSNSRAIASPVLIDLDHPANWPASVLAYLVRHQELFCQWEQDASQVGAKAYDRAISDLRQLLQPFALRGWHCTRLTHEEIERVRSAGILLRDLKLLQSRIDALVAQGLIAKSVGDLLKTRNQASDTNRAGMVWFCFFAPAVAGEGGIGRFFRHWGGEALYNSHEEDAVTSPILRRIGMPCLIEAHVPIRSLAVQGDPVFKIVSEFIHSIGTVAVERFAYEGRIIRPLPAAYVCRVIPFPESEFMTLTGCAVWRSPPMADQARNQRAERAGVRD
jgi:hypothetical protein